MFPDLVGDKHSQTLGSLFRKGKIEIPWALDPEVVILKSVLRFKDKYF